VGSTSLHIEVPIVTFISGISNCSHVNRRPISNQYIGWVGAYSIVVTVSNF